MSLIQQSIRRINNHQHLKSNLKFLSTSSQGTPPSSGSSSSSPPKQSPQTVSVLGLSSKILNVPNEEVGSGASKSSHYKNPEYFCYNSISYFEAEIEMLKYRLPQPVAK